MRRGEENQRQGGGNEIKSRSIIIEYRLTFTPNAAKQIFLAQTVQNLYKN